MKRHEGPLNLNAVTMRSPDEVLSDVKDILEKLGVKFKEVKAFKAQIEYEDLICSLEINFLNEFKNIFVVKFFRNNSQNKKFQFLSQTLFKHLNL